MPSILRTELNDAAYSAMTDAQAAAALNVRDRTGPITAEDVRRYLHLASKWSGIKAASLGLQSSTETKRITALTFLDALDQFVTFDLSIAAYATAVTAQLDACIGVGLIDAADKTAILALANNRRTRAEQLGLGPVKVGHVKDARAE